MPIQHDAIDERALICAFCDARAQRDRLKADLTDAQARMDAAEHALIEALQAQDKTATASYDGLGWVSLTKPRLFARYDKEDEDQVIAFVTQDGRPDLVRTIVQPGALSAYVAEQVEAGRALPPIIKFYLRHTVRFYADAPKGA